MDNGQDKNNRAFIFVHGLQNNSILSNTWQPMYTLENISGF